MATSSSKECLDFRYSIQGYGIIFTLVTTKQGELGMPAHENFWGGVNTA
jgi:hypothetical protein